jgi:hypothetical protein
MTEVETEECDDERALRELDEWMRRHDPVEETVESVAVRRREPLCDDANLRVDVRVEDEPRRRTDRPTRPTT